MADEPAKPAANGPSLLKTLKSRSASERWELLEKTEGPLPRAAQSPTWSDIPAKDGRSSADPFPAGTTSAPETQVGSPEGFRASTRVAPGVPKPVGLPSFEPTDVAAAQTKQGREQPPMSMLLRPLNRIVPYPDYQPPPDPGYVPPKQADREPVPTWEERRFERRPFANTLYQWKASDLSHNPLYFEDVPLERYGHSYPEIVQPFASVALFSVQLLGLPYQATIDPVHKEIYTLGYYRPGEACIPELFYVPPWNSKAAAVEAGMATGLFFLIP